MREESYGYPLKYSGIPMKENQFGIYNYCLGFVDLLGQREALKGQGLLPKFSTDADKEAFFKTVKASVGAITGLQRVASTMLNSLLDTTRGSDFRSKLPTDKDRADWDEMMRCDIKKQHWSDGFVTFVSLSETSTRYPTQDVFSILSHTGSLCFLGLAGSRPIRGAIDIGWGIEYRPGEMYGAVLANAYQLEHEVAQYPRIVVGQHVLGFLQAYAQNPGDDIYAQFNRAVAKKCMDMLLKDTDGQVILHYLGDEFLNSVTQSRHQELYDGALKFINSSLSEYKKAGNSKLTPRYEQLAQYFIAHPAKPYTASKL